MRRLIYFAILAALTAVGCGPVDGNTTGSANARAQGVITAFGSIWVNGVEWEIDDADVDIDDSSALPTQLELGMLVTVSGSLGDDGVSGVATRVSYDSSLEGPVASVTEIGLDANLIELEVLRRTVVVERGVTEFDDDDPLFSFDSLAVDDVVEVSGMTDATGALIATRIEREGTLSLGSTEIEIKGFISDFDGVDSFEIDGLSITFDPTGVTTELEDLPGGVADGLFVEVEGVLEAADRVTATKVEAEHEGLGDDVDEAELEGYVSDIESNPAFFSVSGQRVDASGATLTPNDAGLLVEGAKVKVKGRVENGTLIASVIELRGHVIKLAGELADSADVDPEAGSLMLLGIALSVDPSARFDDDLADLERFGLADLVAGDFLEVRGIGDGGGGVVVTRLEREDASDEALVQGRVQDFDESAGTLTILGLTFTTDGFTDFEDADDRPLTKAQFFAAVELGDLVKVKGDDKASDKTLLELANEVEFED